MKGHSVARAVLVTAVTLCSACAASVPPHDYSAYRAHMPRSVLVLPPLNETVDVQAPYAYLSTISMPLGEAGYYVYPVAVIDAFMKDNGLPTPYEMHSVSLQKIREIIGADAVLYVTIEQWGQKYQILSSSTVVNARARMVDTASGTTLWEGGAYAVEGSSGGNDLIGALITAAIEQVIDSASDRAHDLSRLANVGMVFDERDGLLLGPRSPRFEEDSRGR